MTDPALSRALAQYWEGEFFKDMARLRVLRPDTLTRVTEYLPEIVAFVERIIANGFAYESDGTDGVWARVFGLPRSYTLFLQTGMSQTVDIYLTARPGQLD